MEEVYLLEFELNPEDLRRIIEDGFVNRSLLADSTAFLCNVEMANMVLNQEND